MVVTVMATIVGNDMLEFSRAVMVDYCVWWMTAW
jgi:hypothetical protein